MSEQQRNATEYVIKDYSHILPDGSGDPTIMVVPAGDIVELLDDAKKNNKKITVHTIGRCVLDWS